MKMNKEKVERGVITDKTHGKEPGKVREGMHLVLSSRQY